MIIICTKCSTHFNLDDSLVKEGGTKCRCAVCKHIVTAYPLSPEIDPLQLEPEILQPEIPEPDEIEPEKTVARYSDQGLVGSSEFDFESDQDDDGLFGENSDIEMEDLEESSKDSDIEMENPYLDLNGDDLELDETDLEIDENNLELEETSLELDDDFSFEENTFEMDEKILPQDSEDFEDNLEFGDDDNNFEPFKDDEISFDEQKILEEPEFLEEQLSLADEKNEIENTDPIISPDPKKTDKKESFVLSEKKSPEDNENLEKKIEKQEDLPEKEVKEIDSPPKKERKVIVKPQPAATSKPKPIVTPKPKPIKEKKKSSFRLPVIILLLIFLLAIGGYIASVMTGYKLPPVIDQYINKPMPEISEAKPIPNQKSVNGRFVTNSTAGTLFVITGRVENPSNIAYSHIEIRGALITKDKEEAKTKNAFCGNIITEEMLKSGNISDINTLLTLKEGAHKINVNVAPGASVPFMVVFSDLPEKLHNFTIKIAGYDKSIN